jgi:hypothetical protein
LNCRDDFSPYLAQVPCDPQNTIFYNYFYSVDAAATCKSWYKIYAKLENHSDPVVTRVGCLSGCGPSSNYNYWIASPNMTQVQQIAGEVWPAISGVPTFPPPGGSPLPTATPTAGGAGIAGFDEPTATPPPGGSPLPTATPTAGGYYGFYGCFDGQCVPIWGDCHTGNCQCPNINYQLPDCGGQCVTPINESD